ncbi:hypothetical protein L7F22_062789 [Adiantum nelumboides]|nr:hypothetical protein [Adiantum nelumboides]
MKKLTSLQDLPDELLQACFARLPSLRSVARSVRPVCRRWQSLSDADSLYQLRKAKSLTRPCLFMVSSKYEEGHSYAGLQITGCELNLSKVMTPVALLPGPPRLQFAVAASPHGRLLFILGGRSPLISRHPDTWLAFRRLDIYDVVSNHWFQAQPMQQARYAFALAAFTRAGDTGRPQLLVAGGYDAHGCALASAELYDVLSDRWHSLPSMTSLSGACKGLFTRGKFYVKMANNGPLAIEAFDPALLCWSSPFSWPARSSHFHSASSTCNAYTIKDGDPACVCSHKLLVFDNNPCDLFLEL